MKTIVCITGVLMGLAGLASGLRAQGNGLILEGSGRAGEFVLGMPIASYGSLVRQVPGQRGVWVSANGLYRIQVNDSGLVHAVTSDSASVVTTRLVRPGISTLQTVLERYGQPRRIRHDSAQLVLEYTGVQFSFPWVSARAPTKAGFDSLLIVPVRAVSLTSGDTTRAPVRPGVPRIDAAKRPR